MSQKRVLTEDVYPDGHWAPTFRAGDEIDDVHVEMLGLQDKVVGANTETAESLRGEESTTASNRSGSKSSDHNVDPAPDAPDGEANEPGLAGL
jgi:hypothetical protein